MARAVLERVLVDEVIEVVRQCVGHFGRATGAGAIHQALDSLVGETMDPFTQRRIGKVQRVGDGLEALPFDNVAHGLGTPKHAGLPRLFHERISRGQGIIRKVEFEGPHRGSPGKNYYKNAPGTWLLIIGTMPFRLKFPWSCYM